jgi:hypothetical protein
MTQRSAGGKTHWRVTHHPTLGAFLVGVGLVGLISGCGSLTPTESQFPTLPPKIPPLGADIKREDVPKDVLPVFDRAVISEQRWQAATRTAHAAQAERDAAAQSLQQAQQRAEKAQQHSSEVQARLEEQQRAADESDRRQREAQANLLLLQKQESVLRQQQQKQEKARISAEVEKARRNLEAAQMKHRQDEENLAVKKEEAEQAQQDTRQQMIHVTEAKRTHGLAIEKAIAAQNAERQTGQEYKQDCQYIRAKPTFTPDPVDPNPSTPEKLRSRSDPLCAEQK